MRSLVVVACLFVLACEDARPGVTGGADQGASGPGAGSPGGGGAGGDGGAGAAGAGGAGVDPPDFTAAEAFPLESPGETTLDAFGSAVAVEGGSVAIGAYLDQANLVQGGAVHVFVEGPDGFAFQASLRPVDAQDDAFFATSVAIDGDFVGAGAPSFSDPAKDVSGAAYFFTRAGNGWVSQQGLAETPPVEYAKFGAAVAVSGDTALVSAPNGASSARVHVLERPGSTWTFAGLLVADDPADQFGFALALDGDTALVGGSKVTGQPAAHLFVRAGQGWEEQQRLTPSDGDAGFGFAVDLDGDVAVIGTEGESGSGSAWVFERSGETWEPTAVLVGDDTVTGDRFGAAVAVDGGVVLVGAPRADSPAVDSGAAYVFERSGAAWVQQTKLVRPSGDAGDHFGVAVAVDGPLAVVGGWNPTSGQSSATIFRAAR